MNKCIGCGILLQNTQPEKLGYTNNPENQLCERCFKLKNYGEYTSVPLSNQDYQQIIASIPTSSLVVYVSDLLSLNLSNMPKCNRILLVLTKRDIFPKSVKDEKIVHNIQEKYPFLLDVICVSSLKNYHLDNLYQALNKYANNQAIYFIGTTNSGKSTLINKLMTNYDEKQKSPNITVSMYPSTTLDKIEIHLGSLKIIDTPGLIEEGSLVNILSKNDLKKLNPKKEIKPKSCQVTRSGSIIIDHYTRIDYQTKMPNSFVIYTANQIHTNFISNKNNTLKDQIPHKYSLKGKQDIVIPGLGFIKFVGPIDLTVYVEKNAKLYIRDNLI